MARSYRLLGIALIVAGAGLAQISYFIVGSVPLTAIGLSALMLGLTSMFLSSARFSLSTETNQILLETGEENTIARLDKLIIFLAISLSVIDAAMSFSRQNDIALYYVVNALAYFIITFLFVDLGSKARKPLNILGAIIFIGFLVIVVFRVVDILK